MCQNATFLFDFDFNHPQCAGRTDRYPQQRSGPHPSPPTCKTKLGSPAALPESRPTLRRLQFAPRVMHAHFHIVFTVFHPLPAQSLELGGIENKHAEKRKTNKCTQSLLPMLKRNRGDIAHPYPKRRDRHPRTQRGNNLRRRFANLLSRFKATRVATSKLAFKI